MKLLFTISLLTAALSSAALAQVLPFPLDTLLYDDHYNYRAMAAYDAAGTLHIVHTRQFDTQSATREIYYWHDAGGAFQNLQLTSNAVDDNYATLDFDAAGNVHIRAALRHLPEQHQQRPAGILPGARQGRQLQRSATGV